MKQNFYKFVLFVYTEHIQEDWDDYNKLGKFLIYPAWVVRSTLIWLVSPFLIPEYYFKQSNVYQAYEKMGSMTPEQMAEFNKAQRQNFLNQRYGGNKPKIRKHR